MTWEPDPDDPGNQYREGRKRIRLFVVGPWVVPDGVTAVSLAGRGGAGVGPSGRNLAEVHVVTWVAVTPGETLTAIQGGDAGPFGSGPDAGAVGDATPGLNNYDTSIYDGGIGSVDDDNVGGGGGGAIELLRGGSPLFVASGAGGSSWGPGLTTLNPGPGPVFQLGDPLPGAGSEPRVPTAGGVAGGIHNGASPGTVGPLRPGGAGGSGYGGGAAGGNDANRAAGKTGGSLLPPDSGIDTPDITTFGTPNGPGLFIAWTAPPEGGWTVGAVAW